MLQYIDKWLRNPERKYALGLSIFMALATVDMKSKYGQFFQIENEEDVESNDPRFPMLINKVTAIYNKVKINPDAYKDVVFTTTAIQTKAEVKQILDLKQEREDLEEQVSKLLNSDEDKSSEIKKLESELDGKDYQIDELKAKLQEKGVKVMDGQDLPANLKKKFDRIKEIVPLMAAIHAELKDTTITDEQRKEKALELCKLDDERRTYWDDIDAYTVDSDSESTETKKLQYSDDPVVCGMQMANRLKRLKENIGRNKLSAEKHKANNKPDLEEKALEKVALMENELKELQAILNEKK